MSIFDKIKKLENNLDKCLYCEVREDCNVLQTLYGVNFCDAIKAIENPREYLEEKTK